MNDLIKKHKIEKIYSYHQIQENKNIYFGWIEGGELYDTKIVISSPSTSSPEEDKVWAKNEGVTASNLEHYRKWFEATASMKPEDFISIWSKNKAGLELFHKTKNKAYRKGEGEFFLKLAELICNGKKFSSFGRNYKVITIEG